MKTIGGAPCLGHKASVVETHDKPLWNEATPYAKCGARWLCRSKHVQTAFAQLRRRVETIAQVSRRQHTATACKPAAGVAPG